MIHPIMDRNRKWMPGFGAVLLILLSHKTSALEVPLDRKYCPHHIYSYSTYRFCLTKYSTYINTCSMLYGKHYIVWHNEEHYTLYWSLKGLWSSYRLSSSFLIFSFQLCMFQHVINSAVFSYEMQLNFCILSTYISHISCVKLWCLQLLF